MAPGVRGSNLRPVTTLDSPDQVILTPSCRVCGHDIGGMDKGLMFHCVVFGGEKASCQVFAAAGQFSYYTIIIGHKSLDF